MTAAVARAAFFKTVLRGVYDRIEAFLPDVDIELFLFCVKAIPKMNGCLAKATTYRAATIVGPPDVSRMWPSDVTIGLSIISASKIEYLWDCRCPWLRSN